MFYGVVQKSTQRLLGKGLTPMEAIQEMDNLLFDMPWPDDLFVCFITERVFDRPCATPHIVWRDDLQAFDVPETEEVRVTAQASNYLRDAAGPVAIVWSDSQQAFDLA